jgi:hypothetical protein
MGEERSSSVAERAKELLAEPRFRIAFSDFLDEQLRAAREKLGPKSFPISTNLTNDDFAKRVIQYDSAIAELLDVAILTVRWGNAESNIQLEKVFLRLTDNLSVGEGPLVFLSLRWYPVAALIYAAGITALYTRRFDILSAIFAPVVQTAARSEQRPLVDAVMSPLSDLTPHFRLLPGHERHHFPLSEHLFNSLRDRLDRFLFLGEGYEPLFDRFEVLLSLAYADLRDPKGDREAWAPLGRFAYKLGRSNSPFEKLIGEAKAAGDKWPLLSLGLFKGQSSRLLKIAEELRQLSRA